jgi:hypothetical protein
LTYESINNLPEPIKKVLTTEAQEIFKTIVNNSENHYNEIGKDRIVIKSLMHAEGFSELRKQGWAPNKGTGTWEKHDPAKIQKIWKRNVKIEKINEERRLAFGWFSVAFDKEGKQITDWQEDLIDEAELENTAYNFVINYREGGELHIRGGVGVLVESVVFTKEKQIAIGIPEGIVPIAWWGGFYVTDDDVWEKIKAGDYEMFSIEGTAIREEVSE